MYEKMSGGELINQLKRLCERRYKLTHQQTKKCITDVGWVEIDVVDNTEALTIVEQKIADVKSELLNRLTR